MVAALLGHLAPAPGRQLGFRQDGSPHHGRQICDEPSSSMRRADDGLSNALQQKAFLTQDLVGFLILGCISLEGTRQTTQPTLGKRANPSRERWCLGTFLRAREASVVGLSGVRFWDLVRWEGDR
jgi:hypothetical protein